MKKNYCKPSIDLLFVDKHDVIMASVDTWIPDKPEWGTWEINGGNEL